MHILRRLHACDGWTLPQLRRRAVAPAAPDAARMNYRHAFHAGNFADVVKHVALVALLSNLKKKEKPFRVIDTHAGRGVYDLGGDEARRTNEADAGIEKLRGVGTPSGSEALDIYIELVRGAGAGHYPGSPLIAAHLLRPQDKLVAIEKHPEEFAVLASALSRFGNVKSVEADGYSRLPALLPPPERRGLVLIDPPYESDDEFARAADVMAAALRRFATGIYLVWFPAKSKSDAERFCGAIR